MAIKLGDSVRQIVPAPITGTVIKKEFDETTDKFRFQVQSTDPDGTVQTRWFTEDQIEGVA